MALHIREAVGEDTVLEVVGGVDVAKKMIWGKHGVV